MIKKNIILPNIKLTYRRARNRFLFFFPINEENMNPKVIYSIIFLIFIAYSFLVYNILNIVSSLISIELLISLINFFTLWIFFRNVVAITDVLNKISHPEDYNLLYSLKVNPKHIIVVRFMTTVFFKSIRSIFILAPVWFFGLMKVTNLSINSFLFFPILVIIFCVFQFGLLSIYSTITYIITTYYLKGVFKSVIRSFVSVGFIILTSFVSTILFGWIGYNYFSNDDFLGSLIDKFKDSKIESLFNSNLLPTNWIFNTLINHGELFYLILFQLILITSGLVTLLAALLIITKAIEIRDMSIPSIAVFDAKTATEKNIYDKFLLLLEKYLSQKVLCVVRKDINAFRRANFVIKKRLILASYMFATEVGALMGLAICHLWFDFSILLILLPVVFAITFNISFLGDGILGITSADAERENLLLYKSSPTSLNQLIVAKIVLHLVPILIMINIIICFIWFAFQLNIFAALLLFSIINSIGIVLGLSQVIGTFLYPRLDWEHVEDIGSSIKASFFQHIILGVILTLYLQLTGITVVLYWKGFLNQNLFYMIGILVSIIILSVFLLFYYFWTKRIGTINWEVRR